MSCNIILIQATCKKINKLNSIRKDKRTKTKQEVLLSYGGRNAHSGQSPFPSSSLFCMESFLIKGQKKSLIKPQNYTENAELLNYGEL